MGNGGGTSSARALVRVENEQHAQAACSSECDASLHARSDTSDCGSITIAFKESCSIVADAVLNASNSNQSQD